MADLVCHHHEVGPTSLAVRKDHRMPAAAHAGLVGTQPAPRVAGPCVDPPLRLQQHHEVTHGRVDIGEGLANDVQRLGG